LSLEGRRKEARQEEMRKQVRNRIWGRRKGIKWRERKKGTQKE
jgi:hypothetical protein